MVEAEGFEPTICVALQFYRLATIPTGHCFQTLAESRGVDPLSLAGNYGFQGRLQSRLQYSLKLGGNGVNRTLSRFHVCRVSSPVGTIALASKYGGESEI